MSDKKRFIQDLPSEELVKIARATNESIDVGKLTEAAKFIYEFGVKAGDTRIPASLIYWTYKEWRGGRRKDSKRNFFRHFQDYFEKRYSDGNVYYLLDAKPFDLSKETYWQIRREIRERREKRRKEKEKRQSKKPGSKKEV